MSAPWDTSPGWANSTQQTQTPAAEVFGTPGDGKVPTWNATTGRLEWATPSGGSSAVGSAIYQATSLVLPAAASTLMTFARNAGDDLLDLTDPQSPTAKQAGLYTVTQNALVGVTSAGHVLWGQVDLDLSGEDGWSWGEVALLVDGGADPSLSVSATYYVPAGGVITSTLYQNTGADLTLESWYTVVAFVAASRVT